jgi:hypothetical protein
MFKEGGSHEFDPRDARAAAAHSVPATFTWS